MKVWNLLLIGILSVHCQLNSPFSVSRAANQSKEVLNEQILYNISETLGAYARVTIGLHILGELIEPSSPNLAISAYMNINESIVDAWMKVDEKEAITVVNRVTSLNTKGVPYDDFLKGIKAFEDAYAEIVNGPPIPSNSELADMSRIVDRWRKEPVIPLTRLQSLEREIKEAMEITDVNFSNTTKLDEFRKTNEIAMFAMKEYPDEVKHVTEQMENLSGILKFNDIYGPIRKRIQVYKDYLSSHNSANLAKLNVAEVQKFFEKSSDYQVASRVAQAIKTLMHMDETTPLGRIWPEVFKNDFTELALLKKDLDENYLIDTLNEGENLDVLKKVLKPVFEIGEIVSGFWADSDAVFKDDEFQRDADIVEKLLTNITEVSNLKNSVAAVISMMKINDISKEFDDFVVQYDQIIEELDGFHEKWLAVEKLKETHKYAYETESHVAHWRSIVEEAERDGNLNGYTVEANSGKYENFKTGSSLSITLADLSKEIPDIHGIFNPNNTNFANFHVNKIVEMATSLKKTMGDNEKPLSVVKAALNFIEISQKGDKCSYFVSKMSKLETIINEKKQQLDAERAKLKDSPDAEFYKEAVKLNNNYAPLKEKLIAGSNLFKIFHKIVKETKFDNFFKAGVALDKKIREVELRNHNRFEWILKMNKLENIRQRYEELKNEILILKERYGNESIENVTQTRWLIENLYDLPNPELKLDEWKAFAELDSLKNNVSGAELTNFQKAMEEITDLDFAAYQRNVLDAYANLRGLIRFHNAIVATEKISAKTFWDWNHQWIEIVAFAVITLALNALAYGCASLHIRRKNMTPEESAEREERKERKEQEAKEKEQKEQEEKEAATNKSGYSKAKEKAKTAAAAKVKMP